MIYLDEKLDVVHLRKLTKNEQVSALKQWAKDEVAIDPKGLKNCTTELFGLSFAKMLLRKGVIDENDILEALTR